MKYQGFIQENTKVIPFNLNHNVSESNSKISLINQRKSNLEDSQSALIVGLFLILALAYIIGLVFVLTNLIVKVVIKVYQDAQISSEFYEQTKDLMRFDFEEHCCLV